MASNIELIKILRERTGAGMMDCKRALDETNNDVDKATDWLREKGIAKQAKKADRIAAEGLALIEKCCCGAACVCEVNCETDFVANSDPFKALVSECCKKALSTKPADVAADLAVVVSKLVAKNGTVTLDILQSSDFNAWLKKFTAFLENSDTDQFALATMSISNKSTGDSYYCTGVSHQKRADNSFQSQAQNRSWTMMCASITQQ